jgi:hypothetical protein
LAGQAGGAKAGSDRNITALIEIVSGKLKNGDKIALPGSGIFGCANVPGASSAIPEQGKP